MPGVLRCPPRAAHADDAVADEEAEAVVGGAGGEDLPVGRLVREEGDLREQDAEDRGDDQLEPAVAEKDEAGDAPGEPEHDRHGDTRVEPRGAYEQPALADHLRQLRVGLGDRGEFLGSGIGLTYGAEAGLGDGGSDLLLLGCAFYGGRADGFPTRGSHYGSPYKGPGIHPHVQEPHGKRKHPRVRAPPRRPGRRRPETTKAGASRRRRARLSCRGAELRGGGCSPPACPWGPAQRRTRPSGPR